MLDAAEGIRHHLQPAVQPDHGSLYSFLYSSSTYSYCCKLKDARVSMLALDLVSAVGNLCKETASLVEGFFHR